MRLKSAMRSGLFGLLALVSAGSFARADGFSRVVAAGGTLKLGGLVELNPDCSSRGDPNVRIVSGPSNGSIRLVKTSDFPNYPKDNPRSVCNKRRVHGVEVYYTPAKGFVGSDSFSLSFIFQSGIERSDTVYITVK